MLLFPGGRSKLGRLRTGLAVSIEATRGMFALIFLITSNSCGPVVATTTQTQKRSASDILSKAVCIPRSDYEEIVYHQIGNLMLGFTEEARG